MRQPKKIPIIQRNNENNHFNLIYFYNLNRNLIIVK